MINAKGIDVSRYQPVIDWAKVKAGGYSFAYIRSTSGQDYVDPLYNDHWDSCGLEFKGIYHYIRDQHDVARQLSNLVKTTRGDFGNLPIALDMEKTYNYSPWTVIESGEKMADALHQAYPGCKVAAYMSPDYCNGETVSDTFDYLWVAHWGVTVPRRPIGWTDWQFWQTGVSVKGAVPGIPTARCDLDQFNGTVDDLRLFADGKPIPPKPKDRAECIVYSLRIRTRPSTKGLTIGSVKIGQQIDVDQEIRSPGEVWLKLKGKEQYVAMLYGGVQMCRYI